MRHSRCVMREIGAHMGSKRGSTDMSVSEDTVKIVTNTAVETDETLVSSDSATSTAKAAAKSRVRSKKYVAKRGQVDKTKIYSLEEAITTIKKLSYSKFAGTITLDGTAKEAGKIGLITLPHSTGKVVRVAIVTDEVLADIEAGKLDFDVLLTTPQYMPKLAKFARVLGPKGLMPNPKDGTVTPKPEQKKKELEKGAFELKTEKKQAVVHVTIGKTDMEDSALIENIAEVLKIGKGRIKTAVLSATMSPGVKIAVEQ